MVNIFEYSDHILFIRNAIESIRTQKNRPPSLRMIAKRIDISSPYLSKVLNRKQALSTDAAIKLSEWLELSRAETDYLLLLLKLTQEKKESNKVKIQSKINSILKTKKRTHISPEFFENIADINYITTLLLMAGKHKNLEPIELSKILKIEIKTAIEILETLEKLNLISKNRNKYHRNDDAGIIFQSNVPNSFLRSVYKEMLQIAIDSIDNEPLENRSIGCESFLIDEEQVPKIKQVIEDCFTQVVNISNQAKTRDHIYNLGIQLIKLTKGTLS